jgi:hypothetical protein
MGFDLGFWFIVSTRNLCLFDLGGRSPIGLAGFGDRPTQQQPQVAPLYGFLGFA